MRGTLNSGDPAVIDWVTFVDPEDDSHLFRVNASFLTSTYRCLFGAGKCPGLMTKRVAYDDGCCHRGVTFMSEEDFDLVSKSVSELTPEDADNYEHIKNVGWYQTLNGTPYKTRKKNDRCIFQNRVDGPLGKPGCAFHHLQMRTNRTGIEVKPEICATVPLSIGWVEEEWYGVTVISAIDATDWGGDEDYVGWWCCDTPDAYLEGQGGDPVYLDMADALIHQMGQKGYDEMCRIFSERGYDKGERPPAKMPGEIRNEGRPLLPLMIAERSERFGN